MRSIVKIFSYYLVITFPAVILVLASGISPINRLVSDTSPLWDMVSIVFISWFVILFLFLISLILSSTARENTLKRLANLKERDEREEYITGKAARAAYISTMSVMIFFLFFSIFNLRVTKLLPNDQLRYGHHYEFQMSVDYNFFSKATKNNITDATVLFDSGRFYPSSASIIFILLGWQLLSFNLAARKEMVE